MESAWKSGCDKNERGWKCSNSRYLIQILFAIKAYINNWLIFREYPGLIATITLRTFSRQLFFCLVRLKCHTLIISHFITFYDKSHWNPCPFMALCSNTCISKRDTMLGTKRIELKQVQLPCQAKIHFLCHTMIMDIFSKTAHLIHF